MWRMALCFASPVEQKSPVQTPDYTVDQAYGQVRSSVTDADGKTTGGDTINEARIKMGGIENKVSPPPAPNTQGRDTKRSGATIQM